MLTTEETKKLAGITAAGYLQPGMTLGVGTGSTVYWFITELAKRIKEGLMVECVPTSSATTRLAGELGIKMLGLNDVTKIDLTIDGADEIDPQLRLIKGGGGALLQEKMVAAASKKLVIIADHHKLVAQLGAFPLPVEVVPFGWKQVQQRVKDTYQIETGLRMHEGKPYLTDHGHYILDCQFKHIPDAFELSAALHAIPGVVENGLFIGMATAAIVAYPDGTVKNLAASDTVI